MKALVIEDSAVQRKKLKDDLQSLNFDEVKTAEDYKTGLEEFSRMDPDITFIDVMLPDRSGIDLLEAIKEKDPDAKVVMVTVIYMDEFKKKIDQLDLPKESKQRLYHPPYLNKPYKMAELEKAIHETGL